MNDPMRVPPNSIDAELCVLGSMILNRDALQDAVCLVEPDWFYRPAHRMIFDRIVKMSAAGVAVDPVTLRNALVDAGEFNAIGGNDYLVELLEVPDTHNLQHYANIISDKAAKRDLILAADTIAQEGYAGQISATEAIGNAYAELQQIMGQQISDADIGISEAVDKALAHAEDVVTGRAPAGLRTGYSVLDREILTGGFRPGESIVIAADTSVGKTIVGCDFARNFARAGNGVVLASAEMPGTELANRMLAAESGITINTIRGGRYDEYQMDAIHAARQKMKNWRMQFLEGNRTIADIAATAKRINAKWDGALAAVIVDYLQIMIPEDTTTNREQQVGTMALRCKQAANQMGIPWIMMAQFNRGHSAIKKPPQMANLRDSGQIEQHANIVILMHPTDDREMKYGTEADGLGYYEVALMVPKNRNGNTHAGWDRAIIRKVRRFCGRTEDG